MLADGDPRLKRRAARALANGFLRRAVRFTADRLRNAKASNVDALGRWEEWRERGRAIRAHVIEHLDFYLERFRGNLEERGAEVHFAADAAEARAQFLAVAERRGARTIAKSKSMVTEEVLLNHALAEHGLEVVETDLGEWIVQLAREQPSHIILPAIHKSRGQIRALFEAHGGGRLTDDTAALAGYARTKLRETFLAADVGVSGCNFAVADPGLVAMFTNEGNGRMVTTLPRCHVVFMGMERIVPTLADLECMVNLLPRSATGQKITTYVNLVAGPRRASEADGPDELHVIVLDNGRSAQLSDPRLRSILHCIRCGACLNVCPVYRQIGGHAYGSVYPGPIGAVLTPLLAPEREQAAELAEASSLCGACTDACPVKIPLHDLLVALRTRSRERGEGRELERLGMAAFAALARRPELFAAAGRAARGTLRLLFGDGSRNRWLQRLLPGAGGWASSRALPEAPPRAFRDLWRELEDDVS